MRTTNNQIQSVFKMLASEAGLPISKQQAIDEGRSHYLDIEYQRYYGGYRLITVRVENGGHSGAFNESDTIPCVKANEFYNKLNAMYNTLVWAKQNKS